MGSEQFEKVNDYTLRVRDVLESGSNWSRNITRLFNFKAAQVTTVYHEWITSGSPTSTSQMALQRFDEFQSQQEIRDMREKLVELKGNPPELDDMELKKPRSPALGASNGQ